MNKNLPKKEPLYKRCKAESIKQAIKSAAEDDFTWEDFCAEEKRMMENARKKHNSLLQEKNNVNNNFDKTKNKELTPEEIEKIIAYRDTQSAVERYCEYITGMEIEDSRMPKRLEEDQKIIRAKYGLPSRDIIFENPSEYENRLRLIADKINVSIKSKIEAGDYLKERREEAPGKCTTGSCSTDKFIIINIDKTSLKNYQESIVTLEHEIIHALQFEYYPGQPSELMEYEAYLASFNVKPIGFELFFWDYPLASINKDHYLEKAEWNNPHYFLTKIDGISEEAIKSYRQKQKTLDKN